MQGNNKLFNIILFGLLGISALLSLLFMVDVVSTGLLLGWCYILFGIAILTSIVFPIIVMIQNPKKAKAALIGVGSILVIYGIGYALAGSETYEVGEAVIGEAVSKRSEGGLIAFYILIFWSNWSNRIF